MILQCFSRRAYDRIVMIRSVLTEEGDGMTSHEASTGMQWVFLS